MEWLQGPKWGPSQNCKALFHVDNKGVGGQIQKLFQPVEEAVVMEYGGRESTPAG